MRPRAHLEGVKGEGLVSGWCWDESEPDRAVRLVVLVDGQPVGTTVADVFRADLQQAGIGDGAHAFSYLLPWDRIASKSVTTIGLIDEASGEALDTTLVFRRTVVLTIEDRLHDVEQQIRLLTARLEETAQRARHDAAVMGGVFATIGAFFTRLSEIPPEAAPIELGASISGLLNTTRARLKPFNLARSLDPVMTVCVDTAGSLQGIYGCLHAIHAAGLDIQAEIVLIDDGGSDQAALLPALVGNLRYWRVQPSQSPLDARNLAVLPADRPYVAFLSAATRVTSDWLPRMLSTFERMPDCAILGAKLIRPDDTIEASGLLPDRAGRLTDFAYAEHGQTPRYDRLTPVAAVVDVAMVIRGRVFAELGGFDAGFTHLRAAAIDLCIRCWDEGHSVFYQPNCPLGWSDEARLAATAHGVLDMETAALLAHRWRGSPRPAWPFTLGRALLLDGPNSYDSSPNDLDDILRTASAFQALGYGVTFGVPGALDADEPRAAMLREIGVEVARAPFQASVAAAIQDAPEAYDLIYLTLPASAALSPEDIRALAPKSRIVLALDAETEDLLSGSTVGKPRVKEILTVIDASDLVLVQASACITRLRKLGRRNLLRLGVRPSLGFGARADLWLAINGNDAASRDARQWFGKSILPAILRALPDLRVHAIGDGAVGESLGVIWHEPAEASGLLDGMRLALAPFRREGSDPAVAATCLAAGLPVVGTPLALRGKRPPPGFLLTAATARDIAREVIALYDDEAAWRALADKIEVGGIGADGIAAGGGGPTPEDCRELARQLGLPFRDG